MDLQSIIAALRSTGGAQQRGQPAPQQGASMGGNATPQPMGAMARGGQAMANPQAEQAYQNYTIEAMSSGQQPVPFEQWMMQQQQ